MNWGPQISANTHLPTSSRSLMITPHKGPPSREEDGGRKPVIRAFTWLLKKHTYFLHSMAALDAASGVWSGHPRAIWGFRVTRQRLASPRVGVPKQSDAWNVARKSVPRRQSRLCCACIAGSHRVTVSRRKWRYGRWERHLLAKHLRPPGSHGIRTSLLFHAGACGRRRGLDILHLQGWHTLLSVVIHENGQSVAKV